MFRKEVLVISILVSLLFVPGVFAAVSISQPTSMYNLGDILSVTASVSRTDAGTDYLSVFLVCGTEEATVYKTPLTLQAGKQTAVAVTFPLTTSFIGGLKSTCALRTTYGADEVFSSPFTISTELVIQVPGALGVHAPGARVFLNGTVMKRTGQPASGTLDYSSEELGITGTALITQGTFTLSFDLPTDVRAQAYLLSLAASEGEGLNAGATSTSVRMGQALRSLEIALNAPLLYPNTKLTYTPLAYDQAGEAYYTAVSIAVHDANGARIHGETLTSGTTSSYILPSSASPGTWTVSAEANGSRTTRQFSVAAVMNASVVLGNGTLTIVNTGNVPYNKTVDIAIGEISEPKSIGLGVGEEKTFELNAPDGDYIVRVHDGSDIFTGRSFLTGKAISIDDPEDQRLISRVSMAWILLILLLGVAAAYYYKKIGKPEYYSSSPSSSYSTRPAGNSFTFPEKKSQMIDKGERKAIPVVVLKVKNHPSVQGQVRTVVQQAIQEAQASGAIVHEQGQGMWVAFFTHAEGEDAVMMRAVQAAEQIQGTLDEYNVQGKPQVEYGIGINFGELIIEQHPFKYTALGATLPVAKKLADYASKMVLLSDEAHTFIASTTRCEKIHDRNAWKLKSISRRDRHNNFIKGFMKRQGFRS
ncbi:hypothetical protein FJZ22_01875 [Candidatus Pacearchaeota archaeon]|nr:hypothetical protein [Candidatus Pacearchaeota archaeon]